MESSEIKKHFPHDKPREQQTHAITMGEVALLDNSKKYFILEAGTGVGKSAIGLTLASLLSEKLNRNSDFKPGSYTLTTQKILQQQYINDFSKLPHRMLDLKSSSNYSCTFQKGTSCGESLRALKVADKSSPFFKNCINNCVYKKAKEDFIAGQHGVTNFSYFMAETMYAGKLKPRDVLVIDEAHNVESELSKIFEVSVSEAFDAFLPNIFNTLRISEEVIELNALYAALLDFTFRLSFLASSSASYNTYSALGQDIKSLTEFATRLLAIKIL